MHGQRGEVVEGGALWSHHCGRAVGQDRVPSPSHDIMLLRRSRIQWTFVTNTALKFHLNVHVCADALMLSVVTTGG